MHPFSYPNQNEHLKRAQKRKPAQEPILLVDSHHGIYSAQVLVSNYKTKGIPGWAKRILRKGPDHPDYVQAWADELSMAKVKMNNGEWWDIVENEDIWAVPPGMDSEDWFI